MSDEIRPNPDSVEARLARLERMLARLGDRNDPALNDLWDEERGNYATAEGFPRIWREETS